MQDDSIDGIYDTLKQTQNFAISRRNWTFNSQRRATGSYSGQTELQTELFRCCVFNDTARYVDQGGGKRKGSFAIYIETWHADILISRLERILEKKKCVQEICFLLCGLRIYL
jgi:ribonucleoside-diphosphate reductase alpha chain